MGLQLTLPKTTNRMYYDFVDAYWRIDEIQYGTSEFMFILCCYPTREASQHKGQEVPSNLGFGGADGTIQPELYRWEGIFTISTVFPNGIPLSPYDQKTAIYNWIKEYTQLPFEDVLEN